jgi:cyanophycinase-like exopeptidase
MPYFKYRLHWADGDDAGEAEYVERIKPGELVWLNGGEQVRVLDVVETDERKYVGLLRVGPA